MLSERRVVLGVTGGIAAYKAAELCRLLIKEGAQVQVVLTRSAQRFVQPLTFAALSRRPVGTDLFDPDREATQNHIGLARWAELVVVAPATADFLAKAAHGLCDDLLSTLVLATEAPVVFAPAMNPSMYAHPATRANLALLEERAGVHVLDSPSGEMAEPEEGPGRLLEPTDIVDSLRRLAGPRDLEGKRLVVSAGPTREPIDPVRFLTNRSSGRMGYAIAARAAARGGEVLLVSGPSALAGPPGVKRIWVETTAEMRDAVLGALPADAVIKAAAPADYRVAKVSEHKLKKEGAGRTLELVENDDILALVSERRRPGMIVVGFAAETRDVVANARAKLEKKRLDLCVANRVGDGAGFDVDVNRVTLVGADGFARELPEMAKTRVADEILDEVVRLWQR